MPRIHVRCLGEEEPEWIPSLKNGLEEEGVSWVVQSGFEGDGIAVAHEAAIESSLKIGVSVQHSRIVIHHKQLPTDNPVFDVSAVTSASARTLGSNSARLAKGTPLKPVN
ncbi:glycerol dehydratase reactivase beta/small subunit family protein [Halegenticoccus tardaugens]|uniref:glycerol dehydratase reactivase beta/small subunit family protein n=1 Tax=Halegenticoccus tardaugens TaxID=2071624 RepID=UPI001E3FFEBB|nr:glycerol dehydratase reactivase beta/small subunit family protein [Halegenticoccus tardaugens]